MKTHKSLDQKEWYRNYFKMVHSSRENLEKANLSCLRMNPIRKELTESTPRTFYGNFLKPRSLNYSKESDKNNRYYFSGNTDWSAKIKTGADYARVLHPFLAEHPREMSLNQGEVVKITQPVDNFWIKGTNSVNSGIFPLNRIKLINRRAVASHSFRAENDGELTFNKGDIIEDVTEFDENWMEGMKNGVRGVFPRIFLQSDHQPEKKMAGNMKPTHRVIYEYQPNEFDELDIKIGDLVTVFERFNDGWCYGICQQTGSVGVFPGTCLKVI